MLTTSTEFAAVALAIAKAQARIGGVSKDAKADAGTRGKYAYATLAAVLDEIRGPLSDNELALLQGPAIDHETGVLRVETRIVHSSGQWVACVSECQVKAGDAQSIGSGQTYMRRYGLLALLGLAAEDDDGQAARGAPTGQTPPTRASQVAANIKAAADQPKPADATGWTDAERKWFMAQLGDLGLDYDRDLCAWRQAAGKPRPSELTRDQRKTLLEMLGNSQSKPAVELAAWMKARKDAQAEDGKPFFGQGE